jgi:hypothetical protein
VAGETEVLGENLPQCYSIQHISHMTWPGIEPRVAAGAMGLFVLISANLSWRLQWELRLNAGCYPSSNETRWMLGTWGVPGMDRVTVAPCQCLFKWVLTPLRRKAAWGYTSMDSKSRHCWECEEKKSHLPVTEPLFLGHRATKPSLWSVHSITRRKINWGAFYMTHTKPGHFVSLILSQNILCRSY